MCGIVGYTGSKNPKDVIVQGLKKLEYRGYDSAGVAIMHDQALKRIRSEGKLKNLEAKLVTENFNGHIGIGHTRWATHGVPSERNAHPHQVNGLSLVHNGIIENYLDIKDELLKSGADITSDTDSELVAHLISRQVEKDQDLLTAVKKVLPRLRGAFSILVVWQNQPDQIVAFKDGPPLVVGVGDKEVFIVSDVQAALQYTKKYVYLDDREIVRVKNNVPEFFDETGKVITKKIVELNWSADQVEKMGYSHFMLKEIYEQPQAVAATLEPHVLVKEQSVRLKQVGFKSAQGSLNSPQQLETLDLEQDWKTTLEVLSSVKRVMIIACGTSFYSGLVAKYYIEKLSRIPCEVDVASEFRYRDPVLTPDTLVMTISQSGETADTLAAIRLAKEKGVRTLSICNVRNSTIDREAHGHLYLNCGPEIGVASTKAFMSMLTLVHLVALSIAKAHKVLKPETEREHIQALLKVPSQLEVVLSYDKYFSEASQTLKNYKGFLYMGRGVSYPIALEGALKLKELAYLHAEGYAAGEMKHGPLALIDERMAVVMVVPQDELFEKTVSNLEEAKARGGQIISISTGENERLKSASTRYLALPQAHWSTNPLLSVVPLQLMAFHLANRLGYDVDQPRNLAKSVTVE